MKKRFFFRAITIALIFMAIVISLLDTSLAQRKGDYYSITDYATSSPRMNPMVAGPPPGQIGCYTVQLVDCGFDLGQQVWCNFTGAYGPPYQCDGLSCYGTKLTRHCVPRN